MCAGLLAQILSNMILGSLNYGLRDKLRGESKLDISEQGNNLIIDYCDNGMKHKITIPV
jgi:hypothetical protein